MPNDENRNSDTSYQEFAAVTSPDWVSGSSDSPVIDDLKNPYPKPQRITVDSSRAQISPIPCQPRKYEGDGNIDLDSNVSQNRSLQLADLEEQKERLVEQIQSVPILTLDQFRNGTLPRLPGNISTESTLSKIGIPALQNRIRHKVSALMDANELEYFEPLVEIFNEAVSAGAEALHLKQSGKIHFGQNDTSGCLDRKSYLEPDACLTLVDSASDRKSVV